METNHTAALRDALRSGSDAAIEASAAPLITSLSAPLLRLCSFHLDNSVLRGTLEAGDLAQEAWMKMLRYLQAATGDRVRDDAHFRRLLHTAVRTLFLDHLDALPRERQTLSLDTPTGAEGKEEEAWVERLTAPEGDPQDALLFGGDHAWGMLIEALFSADEAFFRTQCRKRPRRRARYYQAYVLYQLGVFLRDEMQDTAQVNPSMMRDYVASLGVPAAWWEMVEADALARSDTARLMHTINALCDTNLREGNLLAVLRYELNGLVNG